MSQITRQQLLAMTETHREDFILVCVLSRDAFNTAHIRSSINIPLDEPGFEERVEQVAGTKKRRIVVYCADFHCDASSQAARRLEDAGFDNVFDYKGGTKDWMEQRRAAA